jgi:hypothetical protein
LWTDEAGVVLSAELVLVASIALIGLTAGLTTMRDSIATEMADVAGAFSRIDQSFAIHGTFGTSGSTASSHFSNVQAADVQETGRLRGFPTIPPRPEVVSSDRGPLLTVCGLLGPEAASPANDMQETPRRTIVARGGER